MAEDLRRSCELCNEEAFVYCSSDNAFLCKGCDEKVHCANVLVARHIRVCVCPQCQLLAGKIFSSKEGSLSGNMKVGNYCHSCSLDEEDNEDCLSSSSSCVSSTREEAEVRSTSSSSASSRRKRRDRKVVVAADERVESILVNWCRSIDVGNYMVVIQTTTELLTRCMRKITTLPLRVFLAAAFWVAIRLCCSETATCRTLRKLEQISGVPAMLITATEPRLTRVVNRRPLREDYVEGWAEC